jgi:hypothetical protein
MSIKTSVKRSKTIVTIYRRFLELRRTLSNLGVLPINLLKITKVPRYIREKNSFVRKGGVVSNTLPIITEYKNAAGTGSGHYFHQDLLVAQFIFEADPIRHIDIGSRLDGFVAHVATFREIEVFDIRESASSEHPNIIYQQADLMSDGGKEITDSLSCLHVIEHFGLGRYGDPIEPYGYILGFKNLIDMLKPGGNLYISFPIGSKNEVHFNAHRVFHPRDIFNWVPGKLNLIRFDLVDDFGTLHKDFDVLNRDISVKYGCGIYTFLKL